MAFSSGHDMANRFNFNHGLGKLYTSLAAAWSVLLVTGMVFLISNQGLPFLRIRNIPLSISAVGTLHIYWLLCMLAYGLNGYFPCAAEYWIMNIYLPLGIALFHASNTQLLYVADIQRKYANADMVLGETEALVRRDCSVRSSIETTRCFHLIRRTMSCIAAAFVVQILSALGIFLISRRFHGSFGLIGQAVPETPITKAACRRGWEWVLSIIWQMFWSWMYAPYLLWKLRGVRDIHGWRMQTTICCIAGLPASPMWLIALYVPKMSVVNVYVIPPLWFVPSIFIAEACIIFLPCWHIWQHRRLKRETLRILAAWEEGNGASSIDSEMTRQARSSMISSHPVNRKVRRHMYSSAALEKALQTNPVPLLLFSALKDFSGENISFLTHVHEWKKGWRQPRASMLALRSPPINVLDDDRLRRRQFLKAVEIYSSFVCLRYSNFPVNISYIHLKELADVFAESAASIIVDPAECFGAVAPFNDFPTECADLESAIGKNDFPRVLSSVGRGSANGTGLNMGPKKATVIDVYKMKDLGEEMPPISDIPPGFGPEVFDQAAESVKYMVLTNTWPKFVDAGYAASAEKNASSGKFYGNLSSCGIQCSKVLSD